MLDRRRLLSFLAALGAGIPAARAQGHGQLYALSSDDGGLLPNYRVPPSLDPATLRGVIEVGAENPDLTIYEFFDYRCPWCRAATAELDTLLAAMPTVRLALVNNAILSPDSLAAAKVQQSVLKWHGDAAAYALHRALFASRAPADEAMALEAAGGLGFDVEQLRAEVREPKVGDVVARQMRLAADLGLTATPSFVIDGTAVLGWPGPASLRKMVESVGACDKLSCAAVSTPPHPSTTRKKS